MNDRLAVLGGTIAEVKVDQVLIRHTVFSRKVFKIIDRFSLEPDGDLLLQYRSVRIFIRLREIIFFSHF